jgi:pimeloyl-ACP methyl ester carboxylesterase
MLLLSAGPSFAQGLVQPPMELTRAYARLPDGTRMHYYTAGPTDGVPVVLLHGITLNGLIAWFTNGIGQHLANNGFYVIAPDQRGHGKTGGFLDSRKMGTDPVHLLDALGIRKAHFFGYSMGAMVLERLMAEHEDRILSTVFGGYGIEESDPRFRDQVPPEPEPTEEYEAREEAGRLEVREIKRRYAEEESRSAPVAFKPSRKDLDLSTIPYPVLTLIGEFDSSNAYTYGMHRQIPDYTAHVFEGLGHISLVVPSQIPMAVKDNLLSFLQRQK